MVPRALPPAFLLLAFLLCAAPSAAQEDGYAILPGDRVTAQLYTAAGTEVSVVEGERIVDRQGYLFFPFVGTVQVLGLDQTGLRELLTREYARFYESPVVDVRVEMRVSVTGSVRNPGQFYLDPTATLLDALGAAGGMNTELAINLQIEPADQRAVRLVRDGQVSIMNLRPDEVRTEVITMPMKSGDWVHVPARGRSAIRDQLTFWGSVVSFTTGVVTLIIIATRN